MNCCKNGLIALQEWRDKKGVYIFNDYFTCKNANKQRIRKKKRWQKYYLDERQDGL